MHYINQNMSTDSSSSEDLSKFASVAVSGEAVRLGAQPVKVSRIRKLDSDVDSDGAQRLNEGEKPLGITEHKLWDALEKRLDRDMAQSSDSDSSEREGNGLADGGVRPSAGAQNGAADEFDDFRFFQHARTASRRVSAPSLQQPAANEEPEAKQGTVGRPPDPELLSSEPLPDTPILTAFVDEPQTFRKRTHDELVQLLGEDAPEAPNRKKRREELQSKKAQNRAKAAGKLAKGGREVKEEAAALLGDKAKAKLVANAARHERDSAKIVKRRKRHALRDADNEKRVAKGLEPRGPKPSQTEAPVKGPKKTVSRGKFSTARARKVKSEKAMQKKPKAAI